MRNPGTAPAVFLDRDGVINENRSDYVKSWGEFEFLDGALAALQRLASTGFRIVVISNQSAIGRELVQSNAVEQIHKQMIDQISLNGGRVDRVFYCPHRAEDGCDCRKPRPGLLLQASRELNVDLSRSYFVGDSIEDVEAGYSAGCTPILVRTGRGALAFRRLDEIGDRRPIVAEDLTAAVNWILQRE